jgi:hypothetical protein
VAYDVLMAQRFEKRAYRFWSVHPTQPRGRLLLYRYHVKGVAAEWSVVAGWEERRVGVAYWVRQRNSQDPSWLGAAALSCAFSRGYFNYGVKKLIRDCEWLLGGKSA